MSQDAEIRAHVDEIEASAGRLIKALRINSGVSQEVLAKVIGVHFTAISKMEKGVRMLRYGEVVLIMESLGRPSNLLDDICRRCFGTPPGGYTCNKCGESSAAAVPSTRGRE